MKKILSIILAVMMILGMGVSSLMTVPVSAAGEYEITAVFSDWTKQTVTGGSDNIPFGTVLYASVPEGCSWNSSDDTVLKYLGSFKEKDTNITLAQFLTVAAGDADLILTADEENVTPISFTIEKGAKNIKKTLRLGKNHIISDDDIEDWPCGYLVFSDDNYCEITTNSMADALTFIPKKAGTVCFTLPCSDADVMVRALVFEIREPNIFERISDWFDELFIKIINFLVPGLMPLPY